ncbi:exopolysaccharide biosynthesis protein [Pelagerythrobacter marensis]|uniref:Membrane protein n=1 Tax=Pelagerythrobacter marensis TaxID=543877 RepID=A0A0G3XCQ3_9SPHN|nr:exopolysaccharide biosynthesis protein [Pelagerythrobacter marensis]AKM08379.1 membrane protein [Pelagerythrobacter marensis]
MKEDPHSIGDVLDGIEDLGDRRENVCVGDALDAFDRRSFGPVLLFLPLIELSPIGGIPGVPTFLAATIALIAGQLLFGRDHVWLPRFVERRAIKGDRLAGAARRLDGVAGTIDGWFRGRLGRFTKEPWPRIAALMVIVLCCAVPPLEFLPFASSAPMIAIAAFGLALMVRDGLLMLIAFALSLGAGGLVIALLASGSG